MTFENLIPISLDRYNTHDSYDYDETLLLLDNGIERFLNPVSLDYLGNSFFDFRAIKKNEFPEVDVVETETNFLITAELPGLDEKNVDLTLDDGILTIKGRGGEKPDGAQGEFYIRKRSYGVFQKNFKLPTVVDQNKIDASFVNGVLTIIMQKNSKAKKEVKKIPINH